MFTFGPIPLGNVCDNTPPGDPHYLSFLNHSCASDHLVISLIYGQGYYTFLYGYTKHYIHNREFGRKENEQSWTWVSSKRKKGEICNTFLAFCALSRACILVILPQSHQECWLIFSHWPTRPESTYSSSRLLSPADWIDLPPYLDCRFLHFCRLSSSLPWALLSTSVDSRTFLLSSPSGLVGNLAHKLFVLVSHQNGQRNLLTGT